MVYVINTIVNCTLKAGLPDSTHHVTGILCITEKLTILLNIKPSIYKSEAKLWPIMVMCHDISGFFLVLNSGGVCLLFLIFLVWG